MPARMEGVTETTNMFNDLQITQTAVELQTKLDTLRKQLMLARGQLAAGDTSHVEYDKNSLYEVTPTVLHKLMQERSRTFLDFSSLQAAVRAAQANKAVCQALHPDKLTSAEVELEPEEETYLRDLLDQHLELTQELFRNQEEGTKQELQLVKMRAELATSYCKYMELRDEAGALVPTYEVTPTKKSRSDSFGDESVKELMIAVQEETYRLNQIRTMCQKLMMAYPNLGCQFNEETNARIKAMFCRCGMMPDELLAEKLVENN